jgi:hypothetical protein
VIIRARMINGPNVEAVEVPYVALRALPFATAQAEVELHFVAEVEAVEVFAAIARELKLDELRIPIVSKFDDKLTLAKALGNLVGVKDGV